MLKIKNWLRSRKWWLRARELQREGLGNVINRLRIQNRILSTPPIRTQRDGATEVRVLTWRRDWVNLVWALKSFYHHSGCDLPLFIHDGGLEAGQADKLLKHFPDATIVGSEQANEATETSLKKRGSLRSMEYRRTNISTRKLFDFYVMSKADRIITIDSDIVFLANPELLVSPTLQTKVNRYNRDLAESYAMSPEEIKQEFGLTVPSHVNSGLASVWNDSMDFDSIERWLHLPALFNNKWVTEQTLHAMCSARFGVEMLPNIYMVDTEPGLIPGVVCKHYPCEPRIWLYREGMRAAEQTLSGLFGGRHTAAENSKLR